MQRSFYSVDLLFSGTVFPVLFPDDFLKNCLTTDPRMHTHTKYELQYVEMGRCVFHTKGGDIDCGEGQLLIIPPNFAHLVRYAPQSTTRTLLFSVPQGFEAAICVKEPCLIRDAFEARERLARVRCYLEEQPPHFEDYVRGEMTLLFASLSAELLPRQEDAALLDRENRAEEIATYIDRNCYYATCTCEKLAAHLGLSRRQTHRLCVDYYGAPFRTLLNRTRMEIARYRLDNSETSVTELAELLGYASTSSFSAAFKRYFGRSPTDLN